MNRRLTCQFWAALDVALICLLGMLVYCCVVITGTVSIENMSAFIRSIINVGMLHWLIVPLALLWNLCKDGQYYRPICLTRYTSTEKLFKHRIIGGIADISIFSLCFCVTLALCAFLTTGFDSMGYVMLGALNICGGLALICCVINSINVLLVSEKRYQAFTTYIVVYVYLTLAYLIATGWINVDVSLIYHRMFAVQYYILYAYPIESVFMAFMVMLFELATIVFLFSIILKSAKTHKSLDIKPFLALLLGPLMWLPFTGDIASTSEYVMFTLGGGILSDSGIWGAVIYAFPVLLVCILYGNSMFSDFKQVSIYVLPRIGKRVKWYHDRLRDLLVHILRFITLYVLSTVLSFLLINRAALDFSTFVLILSCFIMLILISFILSVLSNVIGFYLKQTIGLIIALLGYLTSIMIHSLYQGDGMRYMRMLSPVCNSIYTWSVWGGVYDGVAASFLPIFYLAFIAFAVVSIGRFMFERLDIR